MDVLSDVIVSMRTGRPGAGRVEWHEPWGYDFPADPNDAGFLVVFRGSCWLRTKGAAPVELGAGDVVFSPRGDAYAISSGPSTPLTTTMNEHKPEQTALYGSIALGTPGGRTTVTLCGGYRIDPARTHPMLRDLPATIHIPAQAGRHHRLRMAIDALVAEIDDPAPGTDAVIPALLDALLLFLLRAWFDAPADRRGMTGWATALTDPAIVAALDAMHREPKAPWTVQTLAATARLSRAAFSRRFAAVCGRPPLTYLTWWRMTLAARLLIDTDDSLHDIAARVGYRSEFAFATAFRRDHGMAPGKYRRQGRTAHRSRTGASAGTL